MTPKQAVKEVDELIDKYKVPLRLQNWTIELEYAKGDDGCYMKTIIQSHPYKLAKMEVYKDYLSLDKEERESTVVHEMCHILIDRIEEFKNMHINALGGMIEKLSENLVEDVNENIAQAMFVLGKGEGK